MVELKDDSRAALVAAMASDIRALSGKLKRRLREQADTGDLTPSQTAAILRLDKDGAMSTSALARAEGMRPQSMGATIAALEALGLVAGAPDPADGRQTIIALTPACRKMLKVGRAARQDWLTRMIQSRLSVQEQEKLANTLELLNRIVD